ncbi:ATP-binding protein [Balneolaceae bacterium YR4-1]|uniref:ATP-binding protein n=1 Tax=Halalkalibaculum roseum TaxID=2709311 RepID=A0A6M1SMI2_9BACT|nr:ATP-binding protein [Halalkalibaculum roseum]NGP76531.1 ATP-binding protein [Halalkalibaculum roseum]
MNNLFEKEEFSESDIQSLIDNNIEENIHLEFKSSGAFSKSDSSKKLGIAKTVSSFANSDGGIVIYGINEEEHTANSLSYIDGNEFTKEWLEQIIGTNINRRIGGVEIYPIRFEDDIAKSVYVVKVPPSSIAPHMIKDNKYYGRRNFQSEPLEEYEVRRIYNQKSKTELNFWYFNFRTMDKKDQGKTYAVKIIYDLIIENISSSIEKDYKVEVEVPTPFVDERQYLKRSATRKTTSHDIYTFYDGEPLFQGEVKDFGNGPAIFVARKNMDDLDQIFRLQLYYSNDVIFREWTIQELIEITEYNLYELQR